MGEREFARGITPQPRTTQGGVARARCRSRSRGQDDADRTWEAGTAVRENVQTQILRKKQSRIRGAERVSECVRHFVSVVQEGLAEKKTSEQNRKERKALAGD